MEATPSVGPLEEAHAIAQPSAKASTPPPAPALSSLPAAQQHEASLPSTRASSAGFRKLREQLMAKRFENHDNLPIAVDAVPGMFIGTYGAANNFQALQSSGITHILCVSPSLRLQFPEHFSYLRLAVADVNSARISEVFAEALAFIDSALATGGKVLVHCFMGRSRSATIVLAYLVARRGLALSEALRELRRVRPQAQPNTGFYKELLALEAQQKEQPEV